MQGEHTSGVDPLIGRVLDGRYRVEAAIGQGGMGAVYRGTHLMMSQRVALKVLRPHLAGDAAAVRRFSREARGTFALDSEHCVRVTDFGATDDGLLYMVMEHLDGRTVGDELAVDGPLAPARVVHIARQVCDALAAAHRLGFVHRDLKPDNVMLLRRGTDVDFVKVLDFGLAKLFDDGQRQAVFSIAPLTQKDIVFGTPEYMSPEQASGHALDPRTDLYSLGIVMFEMLTGQLPFQGGSAMAILAKHVKEPAPSVRATRPALGIPATVDALIGRCLAKRPEDRPASALELAAALAALVPSVAYSAAPASARAMSASETMDLGQARDRPARSAVDRAAPTAAVPGAISPSAASPPAPAALETAAMPAPTPQRSGATVATRPSTGSPAARRWAIAAALAVGLIVAAVGIAAIARTTTPSSASSDTATAATSTIAAPTTAAPTTAAPATAAPTTAAPATGGAPATATPSARHTPVPSPGAPAASSIADKHLRAAAAARAAGNTLKQLAEADSAYRLGKSRDAAWLLGDALVKGGDLDSGCGYLRKALRLPAARASYATHCAGAGSH